MVRLLKNVRRKLIFYSIAITYSVLFWYFFHPLWTESWVNTTEGLYLRTSNFICGLIYIGGFALWNRALVIILKRELMKQVE